VQEITAASDEQSTGVNQINTAMSQLTQLTQQNAAGSEELAATAEEMTAQAEKLRQLMSFFHAGHGDGGAPRRNTGQASHGGNQGSASPRAQRSDVPQNEGRRKGNTSSFDEGKFRRMSSTSQ